MKQIAALHLQKNSRMNRKSNRLLRLLIRKLNLLCRTWRMQNVFLFLAGFLILCPAMK
jgi:hypothetical protein